MTILIVSWMLMVSVPAFLPWANVVFVVLAAVGLVSVVVGVAACSSTGCDVVSTTGAESGVVSSSAGEQADKTMSRDMPMAMRRITVGPGLSM